MFFIGIGIFLALLLFILFVKNPEIPLAILFNGTLIYFYLIFKMGLQTNTLMTGIFYGFLTLSSLLGGFLLTIKKIHKFKFGSIDVLFISFFILFFLNYFTFTFYAENESAYRKLSYALPIVIAPYFGIRFLFSVKRIKKFFNYCIFVSAILIIPAFYELFFNPIFAEAKRFSMYIFEARNGGEDNPILFGITFAILLLIVFFKTLEEKKYDLIHFILIIPSIYLLLLSGTRGPLISFLFTIIFYLLFLSNIRTISKIYIIVLIILLTLGIYRYIPESTREFYLYSLRSEAQTDQFSSIYIRLTLWKEAIKDFIENPIIGVGVGNSGGGIGFPHNIFLEVAAEMGIIGLLILIPMFYLTIKRAVSYIKREQRFNMKVLMKLSFLLFIYFLIEAMFSGYISNQTNFFMSMGLISSLLNLKENGN